MGEDEKWKPVSGWDCHGYEVSSYGRVRYRGRVLHVRMRNGQPVVLIRRALRSVRKLTAAAFGGAAGVLAELLALGEDALEAKRAQLQAEIAQIDLAQHRLQTLGTDEEPSSCVREIQPGEDILPLCGEPAVVGSRSIRDTALEEARRLGSFLRSGVDPDPLSGMDRREVEARLAQLRGLFGEAITVACGTHFGVPLSMSVPTSGSPCSA
jgi:hypothetical protein